MAEMTELQAARELAAIIDEFDAEVAWMLANEGERADLWPDIDVPVALLRIVVDAALARPERERP